MTLIDDERERTPEKVESPRPPRLRLLDTIFHLTARGTTVERELRGGLVTFIAMAYIVVLNPLILGGFSADAAPLDVEGGWLQAHQVGAMTALAAGVLTIAFGVVANLPFALAAGLGINSFLAVTVVGEVTWPEAMGLVLINGVLIVVLAVTGLREAIFNAVPRPLKAGITVGIGLFIAFIGFVDSGFVTRTPGGPPVQMGDGGSIASIPTLIFVVGLITMGTLVARKVRGGLLIGLVSTTVLAVVVEAFAHVGAQSADNPHGWSLNVPTAPSSLFSVPDLSLFGQVSFGAFDRIGPLAATMLVFTLFFTNFFDAMGTMTGLATQAGLADEDGNFPGIKRALVVEGAGAVVGGGTSSSSNTVFVDSAAGVGEGARTGLASVVTGGLFLVAMFLTPLTGVVPLEVAASALVVVGAMMVGQIKEIDFADFSVALPAFMTIVVMPLTYSIANGIGAGFVTWVLIRTFAGRGRSIHPLLWVVAAGFLVYFARGPVTVVLGG
ncbi:NCS2 family permease [Cellulomonas sp. PhB143]|uniref:NCS2 family permease n=1 Tax=Cellulomonas sp. PhB143 TaxID=2485186 RepID=UPI000F47DFE5|nr:NCS2 family permease [Cellulomonas sp. PhB143]ROS74466.1 AGZA family xanthine/uracil permease-like MFS transporter [Cellulomonas sp. PhB143]